MTARGLKTLLDYDGPGDVWDVFGLNFEAAYEAFGESRTQASPPPPPPDTPLLSGRAGADASA